MGPWDRTCLPKWKKQVHPHQSDAGVPEVMQVPQTSDVDSIMLQLDTINIETDIESELSAQLMSLKEEKVDIVIIQEPWIASGGHINGLGLRH